MTTCFAYVRVSTTKQGEGASLEAQKEAIQFYAERNNITVIRWFEEKETAAKRGRPVFNEVLRLLKQGKARGLVVHKIDRSARNFTDWARIGDLADAGIEVFFATESLDFNSRGGRLAADIQAVVAADYIRNLREEAKKGLNMRLKQGLYPFKAPLGYVDNGKGKPKTIDPIKGPLVKQMFELYASGNYSLWSLPEEMERRGLLSCNERPLVKTSVEKILKNPFYTGVIKIQRSGAVYQGVHQPLISASLFEAVQDMRAGRDNKKATKHRHTYRGLWSCGLCGRAMIPELQKGAVYYRCHTKDCPTKCVTEKMIEAQVATTLKNCVLGEDQQDGLVEAFRDYLLDMEDKNYEAQIDAQLAQIYTRLDKLTDHLIDEVIDPDTYAAKKEELLLKLARLQKQRANATRSDISLQKLKTLLERLKNLAQTYQFACSDKRRQIVKNLTSNRIVRGKNIELELQNWVQSFAAACSVPSGAPFTPSSRTFLQFEQVEEAYKWVEDITEEFKEMDPIDILPGFGAAELKN